MALPTLDDLKAFLRIETTREDDLLASFLASAIADVRATLRRPIASGAETYTIEDPRSNAHSIARLSSDPDRALRTMRIPETPVAATPALVLVDCSGATVDPTTYRVNNDTGVITARAGTAFARFPYEATATAGLETRDDYETLVEPVLRQAIFDLAADFYFRRNPAATAERDAGGASITYGRQDEGVPIRVLQRLAPFAVVVW
jgi:hypothetical protein